jgi:hypothetical protein
MLRHYGDALVRRVPSADELGRLGTEEPDVAIEVLVEEGMRLSALRDQDSYSYEVAVVYVGGDSEEELEARYRRVLERLPLELDPLPTG